MKIYAVTMNDGGVRVLRILNENATIEGELDKWPEQERAEVVSFREVDESKIPNDREYRAAWTDVFDSDTVDVDMVKARDIHMDKIRTVRNERLVELDKRHYGSEYDAERQSLRDLPQNLDLSSKETIEELKGTWPEELV